MLAITCAFLPKGPKKMTVSGKAERYQTSDGPGALVRCFCGTCGAFVYEDSPDQDRISLYAGALTKAEGLVEMAGMTYAGSAKDRGIAEWLSDLKIYEKNFGPAPDITPKPVPIAQPDDEKLHASCHCGGVEFWVTRPTPESSAVDASFVHPLFAKVPKDPSEKVVWWIRDGGRKYAALVCMCNSCRQTQGYDIQPWTYIPVHNMVQKDGSPMTYTSGTLKEYRSSGDIKRYFCGTCGANVYFVQESRPLLPDVSAGILDAPTGARAEEWLEWCSEPCYTEFAQIKQLADSLEKGMAEWQKRTGKGVVPPLQDTD